MTASGHGVMLRQHRRTDMCEEDANSWYRSSRNVRRAGDVLGSTRLTTGKPGAVRGWLLGVSDGEVELSFLIQEGYKM